MTLAAETIQVTKRFRRDLGYRSLIFPRSRRYVTALKDVNIRIDEGEAFGILGANGAGKTTFLKILASLSLPNEGQALVFGHDVARDARAIKGLVGFVVIDERSFYWRLTGRQNLRFFGTMNNVRGRDQDTLIESICHRLDLSSALDMRVLQYSTGMRHKLAIARALLGDPSLLLMDEPTRSLDAEAAQNFRQFVREELVERQGKTVVMATHNLEEARYLCDRVAILHEGELVACDSTGPLLGGAWSAQEVTIRVDGLPAGANTALEGLPGVHRVSPVRSVDGNGVAELDVLLDDPKVQVPLVLESIYLAKGRVFLCQPKSVSFADLVQRYVNGGS